jgi:flagellar biosynthesis anti-sigma factor FlgM
MKVDKSGQKNQVNSLDALSPQGAGKLKKSKGGVDDGASLGTSSKVNLSEQAQLLQKAKELAKPSDSINEAKVARLQKMIDEGKYQVDDEAVADRLVDSHMMFPD